MTSIEHSRMLYLLDAIESAPVHRKTLIKMATKADASADYDAMLQRLKRRRIVDVLAEAKQIRSDLL